RFFIRFLQFILGIAIIGLYAQDLHKAHKAGVGYDPKWMYVTVTAVLASVWALFCMLPIKAWFFFVFDFLAFFLYLVAFGIFGKMYIKEDPEGNKGIIRMRNAVWVLVVETAFWLGTASYGGFIFWKSRKARNSHAGHSPSHV
ncbi:hypothetical protein K458DRAFT_240235, partial [Lentithecium fluviatile CBS 122367]